MENNFDTIVAIATPFAHSSVGIIRISGDKAFDIAQRIFSAKIKPKMINYGYILDNNVKLDEVILLPFCAPHSYSGEDIIEIQTHGNPSILNNIMELVIKNGARPAQKGEFTKRAFLNQRIDMTQAEAVLDIIESKGNKSIQNALNNLGGYLKNEINNVKNSLTELYSRLIASVDFPEDVAEVENNYIVSICNDNIQKIETILRNAKSHDFIREGISACLIGKPNAGKSSLFNALLNYNRAIVTEIEGTTRDTIKEALNIDGYIVNFIDTAGIRDKNSADIVEKIGIDNSIETIKQSEIVLFLFEKNINEIDESLIKLANAKNTIFVKTKYDLDPENIPNDAICVSSVTGHGIDKLKIKIREILTTLIPDDTNFTTNKRQQACLNKALNYLKLVTETANTTALADLCASDVKGALLALDEITGEVLTDNILDNIFENFCIGK
ncbi:MAG: tRNA uridine-5-carboxymethylaminomethyl(34) synthesis GTPase MnmE [Candidatus Gastranaerophilales bacterium]|nr:tRNA uridine-5-carboxymethylaminomethyl(34) synthesis GTPase MnmE [Candidatus Gastranaerophilales bacterium]